MMANGGGYVSNVVEEINIFHFMHTRYKKVKARVKILHETIQIRNHIKLIDESCTRLTSKIIFNLSR